MNSQEENSEKVSKVCCIAIRSNMISPYCCFTQRGKQWSKLSKTLEATERFKSRRSQSAGPRSREDRGRSGEGQEDGARSLRSGEGCQEVNTEYRELFHPATRKLSSPSPVSLRRHKTGSFRRQQTDQTAEAAARLRWREAAAALALEQAYSQEAIMECSCGINSCPHCNLPYM